MFENVIANVASGSIIVFHDAKHLKTCNMRYQSFRLSG
jgi:hypothetical protein